MSDTPSPSDPGQRRRGFVAGTAVVLFAVSLGLYVFTLSPVAFPGISASLIAGYAGLDPFHPLTHPVWAGLVALVAKADFGGLGLRLNALSAALGAACVALVYLILVGTPRGGTPDRTVWKSDRFAVRQISAVAAALLLTIALPFWIVSTRAHYATLDTCLLLLAVLCTQRFGIAGRMAWLWVAVLLWGLGVTESATFLFLGPIFVAAVVIQLWQTGRLGWGSVAPLVVFGLAGLAPFFIYVWLYTKSPSYAWQESESFGRTLRDVALIHWVSLRHGFPKYGWIPLALMTLLPWFLFLGYRMPGRPEGGQQARFGSYLLHACFGVLAVLLLFNFRVSPWELTNGFQPLLVTPYLFIAMWTGYLVGYGHAALWPARSGPPSLLRRLLRPVYYPALIVLFVLAAARNLPEADGRRSALAGRLAAEVVRGLEGRTWLLSNGVLDNNILAEAHDRGVKVRLINTQPGVPPAYRRYVAAQFDSPRLKSLALSGLGPLFTELMRSDPAWAGQVAVLHVPDFFFACGLAPAPRRVIYTGHTSTNAPDPVRLAADHEALWRELEPLLRRTTPPKDSRVSDLSAWCRLQLSRSANNLGVWLEERGRPEEAGRAYRQARAFEPHNLSALINLYGEAQRAKRPEAASLEKEVLAVASNVPSRRALWSLSAFFGYIRHAELYSTRGWAWAMSGQPAQAAQDMQRAIDMLPPGPASDLAVARLFLMENQPERSEQAYQEILKKEPANRSALVALAHFAVTKGDLALARNYCGRLEKLGAPAAPAARIRIAISLRENDYTQARASLEQVVKDQPEDSVALTVLAALAQSVGDDKRARQLAERVRGMRKVPPAAHLVLARMELSDDRLIEARGHLQEILKAVPDHREALDLILQLDMRQNRWADAEAHVRRLLTLEPRHALANYVLGMLQTLRGDYDLAESALRTSLEGRRDINTLNALAWLLHRQGRSAEALPLAEEGAALPQAGVSVLDTLANIYLTLGRTDEAENALNRAKSLASDAPGVLLTTARLYEKKNQPAEALAIAQQLRSRQTELTEQEGEEVQGMIRRLRASP